MLLNCLFHFFIDEPCFLNNKILKAVHFSKCVKVGTDEECQLTCQLTFGCSLFSYFTKYFNSSSDVKNGSKREALDCCLVINNKQQTVIVDMENVISGPRFCHKGERYLEDSLGTSNVKYLFASKMTK